MKDDNNHHILKKGLLKKTSITKFQKAMGHLSINVSLTNFRGFEILNLMKKICQ